MELNSVLFPAPKCSYAKESRSLIWISSEPENTPIYHFESLRKQSLACKENADVRTSSSPSLFSSCMTSGQSDASTELLFEADGVHNNTPPPVIQQLDKSYHHHNLSTLSSPPRSSNILRPSKFQNLSIQKHSPLHSTSSGSFNSPIKHKKKEETLLGKSAENETDRLSTPLKRAAEFGPQLKNVRTTLIPCLYLQSLNPSEKILIYFHGNAEDIGYNYEFTSDLRRQLSLNVLAVEYPGYGVYEGSANADQILADADSVYEFVRQRLHVQPENILVFGRSIGSGPACYLAGTRNIGGLILMCPYTSIRGVAKDVAGGLLQYFIAERFRNIEYLKHAKASTLFIHGKKDNLIPYSHSVQLMQCLAPNRVDIIQPIQRFFSKMGIASTTSISQGRSLRVPARFFSNAGSIQGQQK